MDGKYAFIMMVQAKWWKEFQLHQEKSAQSYVHRGLAPPKEGFLILFYVTKPVGEIAGYAEFVERKAGDAEELWKCYGDESVLHSKKEYDEFMGDQKKASFIRFRNMRLATEPIPLSNVLLLLGVRRLARRGFYVGKETADRFIEHMKGEA